MPVVIDTRSLKQSSKTQTTTKWDIFLLSAAKRPSSSKSPVAAAEAIMHV